MKESRVTSLNSSRVDAKARSALSWLLVARLVLATLGLGLAAVLDHISNEAGGPDVDGVYWTIVAAFTATIISARRVHRTTDPARFATVQVGIDLVIVTSLVYFSGGSGSVFSVLYGLVVLYGAAFLGRGGVGFSCGVAAGGYAFVLFGGDLGLLPRAGGHVAAEPPLLRVAYWGFYAVALFVLGRLASTLSTELRATGAALDQRTNDFRRLRDLHLRTVESIGSGIITTDTRGRITSFNPEAERITGVDALRAKGRALAEIIPGAEEGVPQGGREGASIDRQGRDRLSFRNDHGDELFLGLAVSTLRSEEGTPLGRVLIFQDITRVVSMEYELRQSERLAAVGEMAARMAHEIRNPLASISGSVQVLQSGSGRASATAQDAEQGRLMGIVLREVDRLNALISDFLRYSRPAPAKPEWVDLSALIVEVAEMSAAPEEVGGVRVDLDLDPTVEVLADPSQLRAVVWNLWNNAVEALREQGGGGVLSARVRTERVGASKGQVEASRYEETGADGSASEGAMMAVVEIEDTGAGMPQAVLEKIFEPFFTTKRDGTGLGLATVQRLVEQHAGAIQLSSEEGRGTTVRILLPGLEAS
jgi:two-component system sensor histidine kinase PilS (NtrC family)